MIPVSTLDAGMLYAETPEMPMHTMGVLVFQPENAQGPDLDEGAAFKWARQRFGERIHLIPPFRAPNRSGAAENRRSPLD